ncbi:MAG TPA: dephospho-CoA kinase [Ktedonobacterales bacterium]|nr:dephospho-CoA kinase [Ktedonobacterales bacterium]
MPYILGLTGNIASGKTTIGLMLLELGAYTYVDADLVVHELYLPGTPLAQMLGQAFGPSVLDAEGGVDRRALGEIVFRDKNRLRLLESIVHPAVQTALVERLRTIPPEGVGVLDAIKLVESGYAPLCHGLWLVICPPEVQLQRLMTTRGLTKEEALLRLEAQPDPEPKRALASEVIDNSGSLEDLRRQVTAAWLRFLTASHPTGPT